MNKILAVQALDTATNTPLNQYFLNKEDISAELNKTVLDVFEEGHPVSDIIRDKDYIFKFNITSQDIHSKYVTEPELLRPSFVEEYDLFGKIETTVEATVRNMTVESLRINHNYNNTRKEA